jgi:hypothetical protein
MSNTPTPIKSIEELLVSQLPRTANAGKEKENGHKMPWPRWDNWSDEGMPWRN